MIRRLLRHVAALQGCPEFVLSIARWRRFLTFVSQICRAQEPCFTLTLVVSYSHAWQLEAKCHLEQWEFFSPGTAVSAKMCRVKKDENTRGCFGRIALVVVIIFVGGVKL